jgi:hypothetical protein
MQKKKENHCQDGARNTKVNSAEARAYFPTENQTKNKFTIIVSNQAPTPPVGLLFLSVSRFHTFIN